MRTLRTVAELREALAAPAREALQDRARADDGRAPRGPPVADPPRRRELRSWSLSPVREPRPVQRAQRPRALPARRGRDARAGRRGRRRPAVRAVGRGGLPGGFATAVEVLGADRAPRGRQRAARRISAASRRSSRSCSRMALPDVAYFGQKDAQQLVVIRRLVADLNLPVAIEALPTVREPRRPGDVQPQRAALARRAQRARWRCPRRSRPRAERLAARPASARPPPLLAAAARALRHAGVEPEYVALVDPDTLEPLARSSGDGAARARRPRRRQCA